MFTKYIGLKTRLFFLLWRKGKLSVKKLVNAAWCYAAYARRWERSAWSPFLINFETGNNCNESCVFCRTERGEIFDLNPTGPGAPIPKGIMKPEVFKQILDQTKDYLIAAVPYVNGEPLIYKRLGEVLALAKQARVGTVVASNGIALTPAMSDVLLDEDLDLLKVHVSGFTNDVHNIEHLFGDVEAIKANLVHLAGRIRERRANILVLVDYILYRHNAHQVEACRAFADRLGFLFSTRPGNPKGLPDGESIVPEVKGRNRDVACDWLWKVLTINWDGDILPCCEYVVWAGAKGHEVFVENQTDILGVWNGAAARRMRRIHATEGRAPLPVCAECDRLGVEFKY